MEIITGQEQNVTVYKCFAIKYTYKISACLSTSSAVVAIWYKWIYTSVLMHKASLNIKYKLTSL